MTIDVEALKNSADIVSVVGSYVSLRKRGAEFVGLCPFHDDHDPSMYVVPSKRIYSCFSCGACGDVIDFVMAKEGIDFKAATAKLGAVDKWEPRSQVPHEKTAPVAERVTSKPPADAPEPIFAIRSLGAPVTTYAIRDIDGSLIAYECRYASDGKKEIRIWSWGARGNSAPGWGVGHCNVPRPLYGLDRLAADPSAPVLITEGPKKADAGAELLPGYVSLSWTGGANAWHKHDWSVLAGRSVLIFPDADAPGMEAAQKLAALLSDPRGLACIVRIVDPTGQSEGWDIADALADSWDTAKLIEWAKPRAKDYAPPQPPELPAAVAPVPEELPPVEAYETDRVAPLKRQRPRLAAVNGNTALAPEADDSPLPQAMSEDALSDHFATIYGDKWRYVKAWASWFEWRGDGWHRDDTALVDRLAVQVTRQALYWPDAAQLTPDGRRKINSKRTAGALRDLAMSDRRIAATVDQWDTDPWLLGVPGGAVDLRLGKLIEARPEDYITKRTAVAPAPGDCPHWRNLLERVTQGDDSLLSYLQRYCGYVLTGETREECFAFVYGPAQTGKSTFIRVLSEIMGEYHKKASMETFTESRHERHAEELAVLVGARLVTSVETEEGKRWNESRIKALTGRDRIRARFMRENSFEFDPQFKLIIAGNHAPHLRNVDDAMKRRLHIIPFTQPISMEERDDTLSDKLRAEYPQILAWMVQGTIEWAAYKLGRPDQIAQAVDDYMESEDTFGEWLSEAVTRDKEARCLSGNAYRAYKSWCEAAGEYAMSQKRFVQALKERGFDTHRSSGKRFISGMSMTDSSPVPSRQYVDN